MLIQVILYFSSLRSLLECLLASVIRLVVVHDIEKTLTVGMTDRIHRLLTTRISTVFGMLRSPWPGPTMIIVVSRVFQIEGSSAVPMFNILVCKF